jgi:hypothetical protein
MSWNAPCVVWLGGAESWRHRPGNSLTGIGTGYTVGKQSDREMTIEHMGNDQKQHKPGDKHTIILNLPETASTQTTGRN